MTDLSVWQTTYLQNTHVYVYKLRISRYCICFLFQVLTVLILLFSGGWEGILGGTRFEVRGSLQNTLRRCFGTARGVTPARNKRFCQNAQHSAHHQSFTAHLRAREVLGKQNSSYSLLFAALPTPSIPFLLLSRAA